VPPFRFARAVPVLSGALVIVGVSPTAHAFEEQWHLGGGAGVASRVGELELGPAVGLHAAYGLSDVFDLRLELLGSVQGVAPAGGTDPNAPQLFANVVSAKLGLAYKIDVIQWIPYLGVTAGALNVSGDSTDLYGTSATLGLVGGLDYAVTRSLGIGVAGSADYTLRFATTHGGALLRAEYRFGW
jgi:hypothetical protein